MEERQSKFRKRGRVRKGKRQINVREERQSKVKKRGRVTNGNS